MRRSEQRVIGRLIMVLLSPLIIAAAILYLIAVLTIKLVIGIFMIPVWIVRKFNGRRAGKE